MAEKLDSRAVQGLMYGYFKAFNDLVGSSSGVLMRKAGPQILDKLAKLGVDFSCVDDVDKLSSKVGETLVKTGFASGITFRTEGNDLIADIQDCAFMPLTTTLREEGLPPVCPFVALTIAIAERNLNKRARMKSVEPQENNISRVTVELLDHT